MIGEKGRDAFYKGEVADKIDKFMQENGGYLRKADFEKHTSTWVDPVSTNYRGYDVFELPPNGQGIATLQILNILEGFDLKSMGRNSAETLHAMIEAKKIAWADRAKFYADPEFAKIPLAGLLSKEYAAERRKLIDPGHAAKAVEAGMPPANGAGLQPTREPRQDSTATPKRSPVDDGDTIYMCTADDEGNMVSLIQSNYRGMGSGIVVPGLGFMFQDRGELFSMEPGHAQRLRARQTSVSHHHSGIRDEGWKTVGSVRGDGRRDATARTRSGPDQSDRFWFECAGSGRRFTLAA